MVSFGERLYIIIGAYLEGGRLHASLRYNTHYGPQNTGHGAIYTSISNIYIPPTVIHLSDGLL